MYQAIPSLNVRETKHELVIIEISLNFLEKS